MNIFQLECFLAVADYLSFAKAAEDLHISQPAVSHQIQTLESELHVKLFRRTTRFVELTTQGLTFLEDAKNIVAISKRAIKRFESADDQEIVNLSLGCDSLMRLELLEQPMQGLRKQYPNVHPRIFTLPGKQLLTLVENGGLDAALGIRDPAFERSGVRYHELKRVPVICLCREDHPLAGRKTASMEEIGGGPLVVHHPSFVPAEVGRVQLQLGESKKPSQLFFCESSQAALLLIRAGYGVCVLPGILPQPEPGLWRCRLEGVDPLSLGVYCKAGQETPLLRGLLHLLRDWAKEVSFPEEGV